MTLIEALPPTALPTHPYAPADRRGRYAGRVCGSRTRPGGSRPDTAPMRYRRPAVRMSRAAHRPRPITPATTVGLALLAALITVWLGLLAHFGGVVSGSSAVIPAGVPDRLGVVRVEAGESLQHLAARVAPGAPAGRVADRIRELNGLDSVALDAGQTLIAPIG